MKKRQSAKILSALLAGAMVISAMSGCSGSGTPTTSSGNSQAESSEGQTDPAKDEDGDIVVWGWSVGEVQTLFDAFAEDTGYNGEMEYVTIQQTEAFQKLQTTISAGLDLPDAISSDGGADFADIQNKKECGGNIQWQNHYLRNWAEDTKDKRII